MPAQTAAPKYLLVEEAILRQIRGGRFVEGGRIPSVRALSDRLGVAPNTVQQAVDRLVDRGILERQARIGTFVRRGEPGRRPSNIALLIFHVQHIVPGSLPWNVIEVIRGHLDPSRRHVRAMLLFDPLPATVQLLDEFRSMGVGAVGLLGFMTSELPFIRSLAEAVRCVLLLKDLPGVAAPTAMPDAAEGARRMVQYFAQRGRRRIGMGTVFTGHPFHMRLAQAVQGEMARCGLPVDRSLWLETDGFPVAERKFALLDGLLARERLPDALIVDTRDEAAHVQLRLAARGMKIGREMDVVALYSGTNGEACGDPWALLELNHMGAAKLGAEMLLTLLEDGALDGAPMRFSTPRLVPPDGAARKRRSVRPPNGRR